MIEDRRPAGIIKFRASTLIDGIQPLIRYMHRFLVFLAMIAITSLMGCSSGSYCFSTPTITGQPESQTVAVGAPAIFTVAAIGTGVLSYQWFKNGQPIAAATQATYITPSVAIGDSGSSFSVSVSSYLGKVTSSPAALTVTPSPSNEVRFVAPTGSDRNAGTINQPYQTIQRCASTMTQGGICEIRAGTYTETVIPNSNITITSYHFETVTVDGSDPVNGWTLDHGSVYKAKVALRTDDANQIFVGGVMMTISFMVTGPKLKMGPIVVKSSIQTCRM
jgi:Immunoglobulin I-set domain